MEPLATLHRGRLFLAHLWQRFVDDECLKSAVVLSYVTLVAIVPFSAVGLAAVSAFPVFDKLSAQVQDFIFRNFVPATGETVQRYVAEFAEQASKLSLVGVATLVFTALVLVAQIERELNRIWRVRKPRSLASRLVVYWAALTVGPLLVGVSIAVSSYLVSLPLITGAADSLGGRHLLLEFVPFAIASLAFTLAYFIVPNVSVPRSSAITGGILAAVLFEIAKQGFAYFVSGFPAYQVIYGALATIPIFLAWIYLSWVVILLGASVAAALGSFRPEAQLRGWGERLELVLAYRLIGHLWQAQRAGEPRSSAELLKLEPAATDTQLDRLLETLAEARLVRREGDDCWLLARDPAETTLLDLYHCGAFVLPLPEELPDDDEPWTEALRHELEAVARPVAKKLTRPLKTLYLKPGDDRAPAGERENPAMAAAPPP